MAENGNDSFLRSKFKATLWKIRFLIQEKRDALKQLETRIDPEDARKFLDLIDNVENMAHTIGMPVKIEFRRGKLESIATHASKAEERQWIESECSEKLEPLIAEFRELGGVVIDTAIILQIRFNEEINILKEELNTEVVESLTAKGWSHHALIYHHSNETASYNKHSDTLIIRWLCDSNIYDEFKACVIDYLNKHVGKDKYTFNFAEQTLEKLQVPGSMNLEDLMLVHSKRIKRD